MSAHRLIVIAGATGTGKTTVSRYLHDESRIERVMTHTTRPKRAGEQDGVDYAFETPASFAANDLLESVTYAGYQYGSSMELLEAAWRRAPLASIVLDTKGAITYANRLGHQVAVLFLTIGDPSILKTRLLARGDAPEMVTHRLASPEYRRDLTLPAELRDFATVVANDDWATARLAIDEFVRTVRATVAVRE